MTRMRTAEEMGAAIAALRKRQKLTQQDLAERLNTNRVTIAKWETGKYQPADKAAVADALGVTLADLLFAEETDVYDSLTDELLRIARVVDDKTTTIIVSPSLRQIDAANPTPEPRHTLNERERAYVSKQLMTLVDVIDLFALTEDHGTGNNTQEADAERRD